MSQADDFRQYAGRPIDVPIDSNKTARRPRARRTADGKAAAFQDSSTTMGPPLGRAKRTCSREPQDRHHIPIKMPRLRNYISQYVLSN